MSNKGFYFKEDRTEKFSFVELGFIGEEHSHSIKVAVEKGNNLFSYVIDGNETIFYDPSLPLDSFVAGTPLLFPFPNRIEDSMWSWKGKTYLHKKNGVPIQLHSMIYDENSFEYETPVEREDSITLKTFIAVDESHPIYKGYPFTFRLIFNFILTKKGLDIEYILENLSGEEMPYGLGYHPYFTKLSGDKGTKITVPCRYHYEIRTDADKEFLNKIPGGFAMVNNILPSGNLIGAKGTGFDLFPPKSLCALDLDAVYTNLDKNPTATIDYTDIGLKLSINGSEEFKHYVVYTPPGKEFFCIEPQTCSTDAINLYARGVEHVGLLTCKPNEKAKGTVSINYI